MRSLDAELTTAQQASSLEPAIKITLTLAGEDDVVLQKDRIKKLNHIEEPWRVNAKEVELDNSDGYFTDKDLKGYQAVISYGLNTKAGKKYSDTSPMWVTWQQLNSVPGKLSCLLTMLGTPDLMDEDEASESYIPAETDTKTVKTLINEIAGATLACYSHCTAYEVVWESGYDTLADTYLPRDSFRIYLGGSRLAALKRLIEYTGNVYRWGSDGKIYVLKPMTSGEVYDYEYSLESGHTFFSKAYRKTLVLPNKIVIKSQKDDTPQYQGEATSATSYALLPKTAYYQTRLQSNTEATSIAELQPYKVLKGYAGQSFPFSTTAPELEDTLIDYDDIKVVPNPYYIHAEWDQSVNRRKIMFTHVPKNCTIDIYTLTGELVASLDHSGSALDVVGARGYNSDRIGTVVWNLWTYEFTEAVYGLYIYVVKVGDQVKKVGKFAIIR